MLAKTVKLLQEKASLNPGAYCAAVVVDPELLIRPFRFTMLGAFCCQSNGFIVHRMSKTRGKASASLNPVFLSLYASTLLVPFPIFL
jgi:hypothetical protein